MAGHTHSPVEVGGLGGHLGGLGPVAGAVPIQEHLSEKAAGVGLFGEMGELLGLAEGGAEVDLGVVP